MELMSSLLLCALVAYIPQALGQGRACNDSNGDVKSNIPKVYYQKPQRKKILLNLHGPPLVNMISDLQYVFMDNHCKQCIDCMERAIKAYKDQLDIVKKRPTSSELRDEILTHRYEVKNRVKKDTTSEGKVKKGKPKKKSGKSVTVTKYNVDGEVYGIKVKESVAQRSEQNDSEVATCRIYSVKQTYDCDTPESESFLTVTKKKVNKKNKREKDKETSTISTTEGTPIMAPSFRKRQVTSYAELPENFEFSIEELY